MNRSYLFLCLVLLAFVGGENIYLPLSPTETSALMGFLALGFLFLNLAHRQRAASQRARLTGPTACLLLVLTWSALGYFYTVDLDLSFYATVKSVAAMAFALGLLLYLKNEEQVTEIFWVLVVCAAIHALFGVVGQYPPIQSALHGYLKGLFTQTPPTGPRLWEASISTFFNANYFSGYLLLNLPISIYLFRRHRGGTPRVVAACLLALLLLGLAFSGSPGGQVVALLQLAVATGYALGTHKLKTRAVRGALCAGLVLGLLAAGLFVKERMDEAQQVPSAVNIHEVAWNWDNMINRFLYWQGAWEIFKRYPVTGSGPLTFIAVYPQAMAQTEPVARPRYIQKRPPHAHSLYAQTLSDSGLIGFALLAALLAVLFKRLANQPNHPHRPAVFYLSLAAAGFIVHNLIEYNWLVSIFIYYIALLVVLIDFLSREADGGWSLAGRAAMAAVAGFSILGAAAVADFYFYDRSTHRQIATARTLEDVASHAERAKSLCGRCALPRLILARTFLEGYRQTHKQILLTEAERELHAAARLAPYNPEPSIRLKQIRQLRRQELAKPPK
ncbi:MAG: O-antigen ligase family protein [Nitrospinales bacterium]